MQGVSYSALARSDDFSTAKTGEPAEKFFAIFLDGFKVVK
jgi:hypothetical protein